ncbi:Putative polymer-forming cytoskeletal bactofilin [Desulfonema limicola]|uniref:Polymer-forming cytoskeletal bactofilin n=1 Tax=Desulfonema limicola TaxID=45656 RepID=A0A975GET8_9BACT|nr:polymer-forming cytoskeletal protein [Desulfonema limicola]QTA78581.1 Putative polymer-forming cytoskeletal bactofilin [Desulfonema limicola]
MKKRKTGAISTFLGPESSIEGTLEFHGIIRLDGKVKGRIISENGLVIIGEQAVINADIIVEEVQIYGKVNGRIEAKEKIEVFPPGRVEGDIYAPVISIDSGASFNGNCGMKSREIIVNKNKDFHKELPAPEKSGRK